MQLPALSLFLNQLWPTRLALTFVSIDPAIGKHAAPLTPDRSDHMRPLRVVLSRQQEIVFSSLLLLLFFRDVDGQANNNHALFTGDSHSLAHFCRSGWTGQLITDLETALEAPTSTVAAETTAMPTATLLGAKTSLLSERAPVCLDLLPESVRRPVSMATKPTLDGLDAVVSPLGGHSMPTSPGAGASSSSSSSSSFSSAHSSSSFHSSSSSSSSSASASASSSSSSSLSSSCSATAVFSTASSSTTAGQVGVLSTSPSPGLFPPGLGSLANHPLLFAAAAGFPTASSLAAALMSGVAFKHPYHNQPTTQQQQPPSLGQSSAMPSPVHPLVYSASGESRSLRHRLSSQSAATLTAGPRASTLQASDCCVERRLDADLPAASSSRSFAHSLLPTILSPTRPFFLP
ncbi:unnamed protein product [Protopolystoma xenopodis]|uniref:Uncharacterized protein n=1 Tax=Protopolystoma xenopodis TaxID=117903 RepID=A0A3S5CP11_9PLAT|nr:unnamed protein product [Protopolystoma xenopodis]